MLVINHSFPSLQFQECCIFLKVEAVQPCLREPHNDSWMQWSEEMKRETDAMVLQEQKDFKGWMELPFPPLLADLPPYSYFKLVKTLVPADVSNSRRLSHASYVHLWHPHVRSFYREVNL